MPRFRKHFFQQLCQFKQLSLRVPQATVLPQCDEPHQNTECGKNTAPPLILKSCTFLLSIFFFILVNITYFSAQVTQKNWGWVRRKQTKGSP